MTVHRTRLQIGPVYGETTVPEARFGRSSLPDGPMNRTDQRARIDRSGLSPLLSRLFLTKIRLEPFATMEGPGGA